MRVTGEKQTPLEAAYWLQAKDPGKPRRSGIERCLAGSKPIPESLKTEHCCLMATVEVATISDAWRVNQAFNLFQLIFMSSGFYPTGQI